MNLRDYLLQVAHTYDRSGLMSDPAQRLLRDAHLHLTHLAPAGYKVIGSGGKGQPTFTPWIGFFNPDETTDPSQGLYLVYLFAKDLSSVTLMLLQGITKLRNDLQGNPDRHAISEARLRDEANEIRRALSPERLSEWEFSVDLGSNGWRQRGYQAGNVVARKYDVDGLPSESDLRDDLWRIAKVYDAAILVRATISPFEEGTRALLSAVRNPSTDPLADFKPKNHTDYVTKVTGGDQVKKRLHEWLIREYGPAVVPAGFRVSTKVHPRDLMLYRADVSWLAEAKVVRDGNSTEAVREALAQLLSYRHFLHQEGPTPNLLALFTEDIGPAYVEFLATLGIASVWKTPTGWDGSATAIDAGLVPSG